MANVLRGGMLNSIETNFDTTFLTKALKEHLRQHIEDYEKAMAVFKTDQVKRAQELKKVASKFINGEATSNDVYRAFTAFNGLTEPADAKKLYNQYINMFTASADETIKLSMSDANAIVNDEWEWAIAAKTTNASYSSRFA